MSNSENNLLDCSICFVQFVRPLQLGCGHTFCSSCIDKLTYQKVKPAYHSRRRTIEFWIKCPECRKKTQISEGGLPVNYRVQELVDIMNSEAEKRSKKLLYCEFCDESMSVLFTCKSLECSGYRKKICSTCVVRNHLNHPIEEIKQSKILTDDVFKQAITKVSRYSTQVQKNIVKIKKLLEEISKRGKTSIAKTARREAKILEKFTFNLSSRSLNSMEEVQETVENAEHVASCFQRLAKKIKEHNQQSQQELSEIKNEFIFFLENAGYSAPRSTWNNGESSRATAETPDDQDARFFDETCLHGYEEEEGFDENWFMDEDD